MDIDRDPFGSSEPSGFQTPLNDSAAVQQVRYILTDDSMWLQDDVLREGDFTKLMSFGTREGMAVQLYLQDQRLVLARWNSLGDRGFEFLPLPPWAIEHPRWVVMGLVEFGLASWGV
jgi:hypothetical protein